MGKFDMIGRKQGENVMLSPLVYSNNFIKRSLETGTSLSPMKLQKLLYLLYARYYAKYEQPLFADNFEKWKYGPVVSEVYIAFKQFGSNDINSFYRDVNGTVKAVNESHNEFKDCFNEVWNKFGHKSGIELSKLTHLPDSAWSKVKGNNIFLKLEDIKKDGQRYFE